MNRPSLRSTLLARGARLTKIVCTTAWCLGVDDTVRSRRKSTSELRGQSRRALPQRSTGELVPLLTHAVAAPRCRRSALPRNVGLYEHPACQAPAAPLSSFLSFFLSLSLVRPRRRLSLAPTAGCCRRRAQSVSRLAAFQRPPSGLGLYATEHDGRLDGFGRLPPVPVTYPSSCQRALFRSRMCFRQVLLRSPWRVRCSHQLIRPGLPRCCLHGRSCRRDGAHRGPRASAC